MHRLSQDEMKNYIGGKLPPEACIGLAVGARAAMTIPVWGWAGALFAMGVAVGGGCIG